MSKIDFTKPVEYKYCDRWVPARIICFDRKGDGRPLVGLYTRSSGGEDSFTTEADGKRNGALRLRNKGDEPKKFWTVTYQRKDGTFSSQTKTVAPTQKVGDDNPTFGKVVAIYEGTTENVN